MFNHPGQTHTVLGSQFADGILRGRYGQFQKVAGSRQFRQKPNSGIGDRRIDISNSDSGLPDPCFAASRHLPWIWFIFNGAGNIIVGVAAIIIGGVVAMWTIIAQIRLASGTPFPMLPTKKLLIVGPFKYCRNPMTLGTIIAYAGVSILIGSFTALIATSILAAVLISYLKLIEEKELQMRFGSEYVEYKEKTPFIIPIRIGRTGSNK